MDTVLSVNTIVTLVCNKVYIINSFFPYLTICLPQFILSYFVCVWLCVGGSI